MNLIRTRVNLLGPKHLHRTNKTCKTWAECFNLKKKKRKRFVDAARIWIRGPQRKLLRSINILVRDGRRRKWRFHINWQHLTWFGCCSRGRQWLIESAASAARCLICSNLPPTRLQTDGTSGCSLRFFVRWTNQFPATRVSVRVSQPEQQQLCGFFVKKHQTFLWICLFSFSGR